MLTLCESSTLLLSLQLLSSTSVVRHYITVWRLVNVYQQHLRMQESLRMSMLYS
jgi:Tfp pilus assembly protein PilW